MGERRRAGRAPVLRRRRQAGEPIHIRSKRVRDRDASVRFLVILEHRDERAAHGEPRAVERVAVLGAAARSSDRKSTRLNSSHITNSYAVFCLKKKKCNRILPQIVRRTV